MAYPNLKALIRDWLKTDLNTGVAEANRIRVENRLPKNSQYVNRLVVVQAAPTSPGDVQITLDVADLDVDAFAGSDDLACELAEMAREALRIRLPLTTFQPSGAFIKRVSTLVRPDWAPWDDASRIERYTASYRIHSHCAP